MTSLEQKLEEDLEDLNNINLNQLDIAQLTRELSQDLRPYLQVSPTPWLYNDPLYSQIEAIPELYNSGKVVWAALVQANRLIFEPEWVSCAGEIIYDPSGKVSVFILRKAAQQLSALKNSSNLASDQQDYARHLENEKTRVFNYPFPQSLGSFPLKMSSIWFWYRHLPGGLLATNIFPIVISEKCPGKAMVLPSYFWPDQPFKSIWEQLAAKANGGGLYDVEKETIFQIQQGTYLPELILKPELLRVFHDDKFLSSSVNTNLLQNSKYLRSRGKNYFKQYIQWLLALLVFSSLIYMIFIL